MNDPSTAYSFRDDVRRFLQEQHVTVISKWESGRLSLTLREEHRLKMSEDKMLRRIFGPKRDEVTGDWRKLHNEELHSFHSSPNIRIIK
jgi:hypothetical protein